MVLSAKLYKPNRVTCEWMKRARPKMLPPLEALSLHAHGMSPTDVKGGAQARTLDSIMGTVQRLHGRPQSAINKTPRFADDEPPRREVNPDPDSCDLCGQKSLYIDDYDHVQKCERCGAEKRKFVTADEEDKRNFEGEPNRSQASFVNRDLQAELNYITPAELNLSPDPPEVPGVFRPVWHTNNRLQQCYVWLEKMGHNGVTHSYKWWLTDSEIERAKRLIRGVCVVWGLERTWNNLKLSGNPIHWSILAALQMVAERENGFAVRTIALQRLLTVDGLHTLLGHFEGEIQATGERLGAATVARGQGREGARHVEQIKYRMPSYDPLLEVGKGRQGREMYFNHLVVNTKPMVVQDPMGLHKRIRIGEPPTLLPPPPMPYQ